MFPGMPPQRDTIVLYGGGGHGRVLIDLLRAQDTYRLVGVVDDYLSPGDDVLGVPVLGGPEVLAELRSQGVALAVNGIGGIGRIQSRIDIFDRLAAAKLSCPALVHPAALVEPSATLAAGVQVLALAYVGSAADVGFGSLLNTAAVVSHDCVLGRYANVSPGGLLAGEVRLGDRAMVGMGATVNVGVAVGEGALIGNSAVVKADVPDGVRVRAGHLWPVDASPAGGVEEQGHSIANAGPGHHPGGGQDRARLPPFVDGPVDELGP